MLTGYADITATIDAINKGGSYRYVSKPWNDEDLIRTIQDALGHYRIILENRTLTELVRKQNEELLEWNANLKSRVLDQTASIRIKIDELHILNDKMKKTTKAAFSLFQVLWSFATGNHGIIAEM
ncbi:MAG: hypothetical protein EHM79_05915 [Geobacter sp.]|nr:MAG: hypothetical protein EHM79_05915 [Geobacter sp.]